MIIYLITNTVTNKVYVGQTTRTLEKRWQGHVARSRQPHTAESAGTHLYNSMRKHGIEVFTVQEIAQAKSKEELDRLERHFIKVYNSVQSGYNILKGGETQPMDNLEVKARHLKKVQSPEFRSKVSKSMKKYKSIHGVSKETRRKLSERNKEAYKRGRPLGSFSRESIEKATLAKQKKVTVVYKGKSYDFDSIKESCLWANKEIFKNKFKIRSIQGMATRSNGTKCPVNGISWKY